MNRRNLHALAALLAATILSAPLVVAAPTTADPAPPGATATGHRPGNPTDKVMVPDELTLDDGTPHPCAGKKLLYGGHIDATYITRNQGTLDIMTVDGTQVVPSDTVCMRLAPFGSGGKEVSRMVVPQDDKLNFLGPAGTILWHAPFQLYPGHVPIWAGFGAFDPHHEYTVPTDFVGGMIDLDLVDFHGPGEMEVFNYIPGWQLARRHFSSKDFRRNTLGVGGHGHYDWTFTAPGIYAMTWQASGRHYDGSIEKTAPVTQYWLVGSDEEVGLPAGTTRGQTGFSFTAEDQREALGLSEPGPAPARPAPTKTAPAADVEAIRKSTKSNFYEPDPDGIISEGHAIAAISYADGDARPGLSTNNTNGTAHGSYPVIEVPDSRLRCIDHNDPYLGYLPKATGSTAVFLTPATAEADGPAFGFDTSKVDYDSLPSDSKVRVEMNFGGPDGGLFIVGIDEGKGLVPVIQNGATQTRRLMFPTKGRYNTQFAFSKPGIYTTTANIAADTEPTSSKYLLSEIYFVVGNEAINEWRTLNDPNAQLLPTGGDRTCTGNITGADPFFYPKLPAETPPTSSEKPTTPPSSVEEKPEPAPAEPADPAEPDNPVTPDEPKEPEQPQPKPEAPSSTTKAPAPAPKPEQPVAPKDPEQPKPKPEAPSSTTKAPAPAPKPEQPVAPKDPEQPKPKPEAPSSTTKVPAPAPKPEQPVAPKDPEQPKPKPEAPSSTTKVPAPAPKPEQPVAPKDPEQPKPKPEAPSSTTKAPAPAPKPAPDKPADPRPNPSPTSNPAQQLSDVFGEFAPNHLVEHGHMDLALGDTDAGRRAYLMDGADPANEVSRAGGSFVIAADNRVRYTSLPTSITEKFPEFAAGGWALPQVQESGVPWVGFSTDHADHSTIDSNGVTVRLASFEGPGRMVTGHMDFRGVFDAKLDSGQQDSAMVYATAAHDHQYFLFSKPGAYRAELEYSWTDTQGVAHKENLVTFFAVSTPFVDAARTLVESSAMPVAPALPDEDADQPGDSPAPAPVVPTSTTPTPAPAPAPKPVAPVDPVKPAPQPGTSEAPKPAPKPTSVPAPAPGAGEKPAPVAPIKPVPPVIAPADPAPAPSKQPAPKPQPAASSTAPSAVPAPHKPDTKTTGGQGSSLKDTAGLIGAGSALLMALNRVGSVLVNLIATLVGWLFDDVGSSLSSDSGDKRPAAHTVAAAVPAPSEPSAAQPVANSPAPVAASVLPGAAGAQLRPAVVHTPLAGGQPLAGAGAAASGPVAAAAAPIPLVPMPAVESRPLNPAPSEQHSTDEHIVQVAQQDTRYAEGVLVGVGVMSLVGALIILATTVGTSRRR